MLAHQGIGRGVSDPLVERRGTLEVGEHDGDEIYTDVVTGPQNIPAEKIPKCLQGGSTFDGQRVAPPDAFLDNEGLPFPTPVAEAQPVRSGRWLQHHCIVSQRDTRKVALVPLETVLRPWCQSTGAVAAVLQVDLDDARCPGLECKLNLDVGCTHRPEQTILPRRYRSHRL